MLIQGQSDSCRLCKTACTLGTCLWSLTSGITNDHSLCCLRGSNPELLAPSEAKFGKVELFAQVPTL